MQNHEALEKFGQFIMEELRDKIIDNFERLEQGLLKSPSTQQLIKDLNNIDQKQKEVFRRVLINSIDCGIHGFLFKVQEEHELDGDIKVVVNEVNIAEVSDGLHGELFTEDGWINKYSQYEENND